MEHTGLIGGVSSALEMSCHLYSRPRDLKESSGATWLSGTQREERTDAGENVQYGPSARSSLDTFPKETLAWLPEESGVPSADKITFRKKVMSLNGEM